MFNEINPLCPTRSLPFYSTRYRPLLLLDDMFTVMFSEISIVMFDENFGIHTVNYVQHNINPCKDELRSKCSISQLVYFYLFCNINPCHRRDQPFLVFNKVDPVRSTKPIVSFDEIRSTRV